MKHLILYSKMEYQKIGNLLGETIETSSKYVTKY